MRFALMTGMAIGYVLGTRAGRERYEQLRNTWGAFARSQPAQQLTAGVRATTSKAGHTLKEKAAAGVSKGTHKLRSRNGSSSWPRGA